MGTFSSLSSVEDFLDNVSSSIKQFIQGLTLSAAVVSSGAAFAEQLSLAQSGDRGALSSITRSAQTYLGSQDFSSRADMQRFEADLARELLTLNQVTPEEFLAKEITDALSEQTTDINDKLGELPAGLQAVVNSTKYDISALIDFAVNDTDLSAAQRELIFNGTKEYETILTASLADGVLSEDEKTLLNSTSSNIVKSLEANGGDLTEDQRTLLNGLTGNLSAALDATVALEAQELTGIEKNTLDTATEAAKQIIALDALTTEMSALADPMGEMKDAMLSLRDVLFLQYKETAKATIESQAADLMANLESEKNKIFKAELTSLGEKVSAKEAVKDENKSVLESKVNRIHEILSKYGMTRKDGLYDLNYDSVTGRASYDNSGAIYGKKKYFDDVGRALEAEGLMDFTNWNLNGHISTASNYKDRVSGRALSVYNSSAIALNSIKDQYANLASAGVEGFNFDRYDSIEAYNQQLQDLRDQLEKLGMTAGFINGSHATGLSYVPFDGYRAELHQGERVMPARENFGFNAMAQEITRMSSEIKNLRNISEQHYVKIERNTTASADTLDRWDVVGQPEVRE
jgi:hypothetical protein